MSSALREVNTKDFMDPINLVQLADDTALFADNIKSLQVKFSRRGAVVKGVEHISTNLKVNICVARVLVPLVLSVRI